MDENSKTEIFRRVALERLSTPEQLDQAMRVVRPAHILFLICSVIVIFGAVLWSFLATAPIKVVASGILIKPGGVLAVSADQRGRILELLVGPGQTVKVGQQMARIEQPDLRQELETAKREKVELEGQRAQIITFQQRDMTVQTALLQQKKRDVQASLTHVKDRIKWLEERERNELRLLDRQIIDRNRYINTKIELNTAREDLAKGFNELKQIERDETALTIGKERELLDKQMAIGSVARKIEGLEERLARQSVVLSPYSGTIVEFQVNEGEMVEAGTALLNLLPHDGADDDKALLAVVYAPPTDGKKIKPGMKVQIAPSTVKKEEYGFIMGRVASVAEIPSTAEGMMRVLKNQQLVQALSGKGGAPFEVVVDLALDPATPTGFAWSSSRGPEGEINTGTLAEAEITVREVHLISLALPAFEPLLDK